MKSISVILVKKDKGWLLTKKSYARKGCQNLFEFVNLREKPPNNSRVLRLAP